MKKNVSNIILLHGIILLSIFLASCRGVEPDTPEKLSFLTQTNHGYYKEMEAVFVNDGNIDLQESINNNRYQFRIQSNDQSRFLNLKFASAPKRVNSYVDMECDYYYYGTYLKETYEMHVTKVDASIIWLWNTQANLGVIIPRF